MCKLSTRGYRNYCVMTLYKRADLKNADLIVVMLAQLFGTIVSLE